MQVEEYLQEWDKDVEIDYDELGQEARKIPKLHAKYLRWLTQEKMTLKALETQYKVLYMEKMDYYVDGPANMAEYEAKKAMWKFVPERNKSYLRAAVGQYLEVDEDLRDLNDKKEITQNKINALDLMMKQIMGRGFLINNMIQWVQYTGGGK